MKRGSGWHGESRRHSMARRGITSARGVESVDFPKGGGMDIEFAVYVPSTLGKNLVGEDELNERVRDVSRFLSRYFGGYTEVESRGGWINKEGDLVKEPVVMVKVFTDHKTYAMYDLIIKDFLKQKKKDWKQKSMGYEYEGGFFEI